MISYDIKFYLILKINEYNMYIFDDKNISVINNNINEYIIFFIFVIINCITFENIINKI